ncbi:MAG: SRPBCC family protein [Acidobacteria bacterium]|nr:SRPBCC family protein [Acidobacteriota bacterium]
MANKTTITAEPGKQELFITREFDFPRELVFKAHTDPDIYQQWVGPNGMTMTIEKWDYCEGGEYRFVHERDGHKYAFFGMCHEVKTPERIIGTFEFDGLPERGHVIMGKTTFEELPGNRTRLVHQSVFFSVADRDGMIQSGMERGVNDGYEKLDAILEKRREPNNATAA